MNIDRIYKLAEKSLELDKKVIPDKPVHNEKIRLKAMLTPDPTVKTRIKSMLTPDPERQEHIKKMLIPSPEAKRQFKELQEKQKKFNKSIQPQL